MGYVMNGICGCLRLLFNFIFICTLIDFRFSKKTTVVIVGAAWGLCAAISALTYVTGYIANHIRVLSMLVFVYFIVIAITSFIIGKGFLSKKLFAVLFTINTFLFTVSASYMISRALFGDGTSILSETAIRAVLYAIFCFVSYKLARPAFIDDAFYHKATWILFDVVALLFYVCICYINVRFGTIASSYSREPLLALMICGLMMVTFGAMFYVFTQISRLNRKTIEVERVRTKELLLSSELEAQENAVYQAKRIRHDVKHHMNIISAYLSEQKYEEAGQYLAEYSGAIEDSAVPEYSKNHIVNAIFRLYDDKCRKCDIACSLFTDVPEKLNMEDTKLCGLLSNMLENAVESCKKCENPTLSFRLTYKAGRLCGYLDNTTAAPLQIKDGFRSAPRRTAEPEQKSFRRLSKNTAEYSILKEKTMCF